VTNPLKDDLPAGLAPMPDARYAEMMAGLARQQANDFAGARRAFESILEQARDDGDEFGVLTAQHMLGNVAFNQCRDAESRHLHETVLRVSEAHDFAWGVATSLGNIAFVDFVDGDRAESDHKLRAAIAAYRDAGMPERADALEQVRVSVIEGGEALPIPRLVAGQD
jgi:hypothetical protein